jgi:hypothetical protein
MVVLDHSHVSLFTGLVGAVLLRSCNVQLNIIVVTILASDVTGVGVSGHETNRISIPVHSVSNRPICLTPPKS